MCVLHLLLFFRCLCLKMMNLAITIFRLMIVLSIHHSMIAVSTTDVVRRGGVRGIGLHPIWLGKIPIWPYKCPKNQVSPPGNPKTPL